MSLGGQGPKQSPSSWKRRSSRETLDHFAPRHNMNLPTTWVRDLNAASGTQYLRLVCVGKEEGLRFVVCRGICVNCPKLRCLRFRDWGISKQIKFSLPDIASVAPGSLLLSAVKPVLPFRRVWRPAQTFWPIPGNRFPPSLVFFFPPTLSLSGLS